MNFIHFFKHNYRITGIEAWGIFQKGIREYTWTWGRIYYCLDCGALAIESEFNRGQYIELESLVAKRKEDFESEINAKSMKRRGIEVGLRLSHD